MQTYTSRPFTIKKDNATVYGVINCPKSLEALLDRAKDVLPAKDVVLGEDSVSVKAPMIGELRFVRSASEEPSMVKYQGEGTPVPMAVCVYLTPDGLDRTTTQIAVEADVPQFLSGMIKTKVNPLLEKVANTLESLDLDKLLGAE